MEVLAVLLSLYLVTVNTDLTTVDLLAFFGYKYVGYVLSYGVFFTWMCVFDYLFYDFFTFVSLSPPTPPI